MSEKCPVCKGRQTMPEDFYEGNGSEKKVPCRSCDASGIVESRDGRASTADDPRVLDYRPAA